MMKGKIEWIPIKVRELTYEERKEYYDEEYDLAWNCPIPNDGEEVLITLINGLIDITLFYNDSFEDYDWYEITAWASLPEPYKE